MTWRVQVDTSRCISSGVCVGTAPERFRFDEQKQSRPVSDVIEDDEAVRDAAASCPVEAISLTDIQTGSPIPQDE